MKKLRWLRAVLSVLVVMVAAVALAACGGDDTATEGGGGGGGGGEEEQSTEPIKIGAPVDLSGVFAVYGEQQRQAAELAVKEINEDGGINGRQVEIVFADAQSDIQPAVEQVTSLIEREQVDAIIGIVSSAARDAVIPRIARAEKVYIYPTTYEGGVAEKFSGKGAKYVFTTGPVSEQYISPFMPYLVENYGAKVYILAMDYIYGTGSAEAAKAALAEAGGEVVGEELVPLGTTDFSAILNRVEQANPDVVYAVIAGEDLVFLMKQFREFGLDDQGVTFATTELDESYFKGLGAQTVAGTPISLPYFVVMDNPENQRWLEAMRAEYGNDYVPGLAAESMYYSVKLFAEAAKKAGGVETEALIAALEETSIETPQGEVSIRKEDHQAIMGNAIAIVDPNPDAPPYEWVKIQETFDRIEPSVQGQAE
jgi:urea transport system substrate-binding protein